MDTKVKEPHWPANNYYNPVDDNLRSACPFCVENGSPCVWSRKGTNVVCPQTSVHER